VELDENVAGLEVPVDNTEVVNTLHALGDGESDIDHHAVVEAKPVCVLVQEVVQVTLEGGKKLLWRVCVLQGDPDLHRREG